MRAAPTIPLTETLRAAILAVRQSTRVAMAERAARLADNEARQRERLTLRTQIEGQMASYPVSNDVLSEDEAVKLAAAQLRMASVDKNLERLKAEAAAIPVVFLDEATVVLMALSDYWMREFIRVAGDALAPFEPVDQRRSEIAATLTGMEMIRRVKYHAARFGVEATENSFGRINALFDRFLEGKPYLGDDGA